MEPILSPAGGSGNSGTEMAESLRFEEEIQSLIRPNFDAPSSTGRNSFTALLGLSPNHAVELLHDSDSGSGAGVDTPAAANAAFCEMSRPLLRNPAALRLPIGCFPTFPSDAGLVERAARFSVFAAEESSLSRSSFGKLSPMPKTEPVDSNGSPPCPNRGDLRQRAAKRKDAEKGGKAKVPAKKSKTSEEDIEKTVATPRKETTTGCGEKLPYVHVRARRGQATDSHSLAERARREKINARMKLLQDLVPGCSKISGTALVLDEIINHVRSLQRQVEFLSMILSAVYPRMDFPCLDNFLPTEGGVQQNAGNGDQSMEFEVPMCDSVHRGAWWQQQQQIWQVADPLAASNTTMWEGDETPHSISKSPKDASVAASTAPPIFSYNSKNAAYLFLSSLSPEVLEGLLGSVGREMAFRHYMRKKKPLSFKYAGHRKAIQAVFLGMSSMSARKLISMQHGK